MTFDELEKTENGRQAASDAEREALNAEIIMLLEKLGIIAPESSTGEGATQ